MDFSSSIAFDGDLGDMLNELGEVFSGAFGSKRPNSELFLMCAYIGMNLEFEELDEVDSYKNSRKIGVGQSFNIAPVILMKDSNEYRTALFCTYIKMNRDNLVIGELQNLWNLEHYPSRNSNDKLVVSVLDKLYAYVSDGAYYMGTLFFENELSIDIINDIVLKIYQRNKMDDLVISNLDVFSEKVDDLSKFLN